MGVDIDGSFNHVGFTCTDPFLFGLNAEEIVGFQSRRIVRFQWREIFEKR